MFKSSLFNITQQNPDKTIIKNILTGGIVSIPASSTANEFINSLSVKAAEKLAQATGILVPSEFDEGKAWRDEFLKQRNHEATSFTLFFVPSLNCQMNCHYCFEKGTDRSLKMSPAMADKLLTWTNDYLNKHHQIKTFRIVLFGGEPLLQKKLLLDFLPKVQNLVKTRQLILFAEILTNGELLNDECAILLRDNGFQRIQITLDGPQLVHDQRRFRKNGKKNTFETIIGNIKNIFQKDHFKHLDLRVSFDEENADSIPQLLHFLKAELPNDSINLSIGLTTPSLGTDQQEMRSVALAKKAIETWALAKSLGFRIPKDFKVGPWCVAVAKHSIAVQPDGKFHKCFCTSGRKEFDFGSVDHQPEDYGQDPIFEDFSRFDSCIKEKCPYLPVCGGGCLYDAVVKYKSKEGARKRFCQRKVIDVMNQGLLKLNYDLSKG
jgi:uncharacterized protein